MKTIIPLIFLLLEQYPLLVTSRFHKLFSAVPMTSPSRDFSSSSKSETSSGRKEVPFFGRLANKGKKMEDSSTGKEEQATASKKKSNQKKSLSWRSSRKPLMDEDNEENKNDGKSKRRKKRREGREEKQKGKGQEAIKKDNEGADEASSKVPQRLSPFQKRRIKQQAAQQERLRAREKREQKSRKVHGTKDKIDTSMGNKDEKVRSTNTTEAQSQDEAPNATHTNMAESESNTTTLTNETMPPKRPTVVLMGAGTPPGLTSLYRPGAPIRQQAPSQPSSHALIVASLASVVSIVSRLWIVLWITKRLASEQETIRPVQRFVWECLNDRYKKDDEVLKKTLSEAPAGIPQRKWNKFLKATRSNKSLPPSLPSKTVVVVDITPKMQLDMQYLSDVVTFLIGASNKQMFGMNPEIVLLVKSPGGEVTSFGLAAAQVARLERTGIDVTVCIDNIAASGGYMIASQASQIVAAPFAIVGSIGVFKEGLNFNKILNNYGITPLVIKAGEMKNPLSSIGPVTKDEIKKETERLEKVHEAFVQMCVSRRSGLNTSVCDGSVWIGSQAIRYGMVDRVLTSGTFQAFGGGEG